VADIDGILRGKYIHKDKFESAIESGFGFCDVVFGGIVTTSATTIRR
jgi:glutamine synthetase